ncbi:sulfite oxidase [Verticillium alfalfae VaMs.102]|uniref:Sulfite oxidase n=1 Tax=Verticillium alfalfae (strain VaMs.102 / ATCC MYA-4576 / FGSC 10136) TaxID=526221 RepID=C9SQ66_VERA1|nr:sulfite oxidase [Verticillium alfalfae VaMs.102]EEY20991.1 sulfite oxidase [Verticillium alfalfae VaMs.102]
MQAPRRLTCEISQLATTRQYFASTVRPSSRRCQYLHTSPSPRAPPKSSSPSSRPRTSWWRTSRRARPATVTLIASAGLLSAFAGFSEPTSTTKDEAPPPPESNDSRDPKQPRFRLSEVKEHGPDSERPWVTHEDKVYDITDWIGAHPGGDVILRAAGGSIDPYWNIFTVHKAPYVREILAQYMIGLIDVADLVDGQPPAELIEDPFRDDPTRDQRLTHPDWTTAPAIQEMPITSAITAVKLGPWTTVPPMKAPGGRLLTPPPEARGREAAVTGYAYSGGGRRIVRVDVSLDNGRTWDQARLLADTVKPGPDRASQDHGHKSWAWQRWRYDGVVPFGDGPEGGKVCSTLLVKATDEAYNAQPDGYEAIWNFRGNLTNAWHRYRVCSECQAEKAVNEDNR